MVQVCCLMLLYVAGFKKILKNSKFLHFSIQKTDTIKMKVPVVQAVLLNMLFRLNCIYLKPYPQLNNPAKNFHRFFLNIL